MLSAGLIFSAGLTGFLGVCALFVCREDGPENATGGRRHLPCSGFSDDEAARMLGLGGGDISLPEQLRRHASGPHPDHLKFPVHGREK